VKHRKLILNAGLFVACFLIATAALFIPSAHPRATFVEWAGFMQVVSVGLSASFTLGNAAEHYSNGRNNTPKP
jgi:hypothetical protein